MTSSPRKAQDWCHFTRMAYVRSSRNLLDDLGSPLALQAKCNLIYICTKAPGEANLFPDTDNTPYGRHC